MQPSTPTADRRGALVLALVLVLVLGAGGLVVWWRGSFGGVIVQERCTATASGSSATLDPDQAGNAAIIAAVAVRRELPARAATIGIATAMQESKLHNLAYGDRDSLGLFQQRPSQGWGTTAQVRDPVYASNAFYDVLVKIEGFQSLDVTDVAQRVQRSAFPQAYADHEADARLFASGLAGYSPGGVACTLRPASTAGSAARVAAAARAETGRVAAAASDPSVVRFTLPGAEARRLGWALASWAVARAGGLDIASVETDGKVWSRAAATSQWKASGSAGAPKAAVVPAGTVVVHLAAARS